MMEISNSKLDECLQKLESCLEACFQILYFPYDSDNRRQSSIVYDNQEMPKFYVVCKEIDNNILNVADSRLNFYISGLYKKMVQLNELSDKYHYLMSEIFLDYLQPPISKKKAKTYFDNIQRIEVLNATYWKIGYLCIQYAEMLANYILESGLTFKPSIETTTEPSIETVHGIIVKSAIYFFIVLYVAGKIGAVEPFVADNKNGSSENENRQKVKIAAEWGMRKWGLKHKVSTLQDYTKENLKEKKHRKKFPTVILFLCKYYPSKEADIKRILAEFEPNE